MGWLDKLKAKAKDPEVQRQVREGAQKAAAAHKARQARPPQRVPPRGVSRGGSLGMPYDGYGNGDGDLDNDGVPDAQELAANDQQQGYVADDQFEQDCLAADDPSMSDIPDAAGDTCEDTGDFGGGGDFSDDAGYDDGGGDDGGE